MEVIRSHLVKVNCVSQKPHHHPFASVPNEMTVLMGLVLTIAKLSLNVLT